MKNVNYGLAVVALVAAGAFGTSAADASVIIGESYTYNFTSDHCSGGGCLEGQTSGGTILLTQTGVNTVSVDVELANGNQFINAGFDASFGFNLINNPSILYAGIAPVPGTIGFSVLGSNPQSAAAAPGLHMDGTGFFEYGLTAVGPGGSNPNGSSLVFNITAAGLDINSFEGNTAGEYFAADIISGTAGCPPAGATCRTGGIDAHDTIVPPPGVPAPGNTLGLLGIGMIGTVGAVAWRRRKNDDAPMGVAVA